MEALQQMSDRPDSHPISSEIIDLYKEIGEYERHFNGIQSDYRRLASQWLIAAFAAIGFVMSSTSIIDLPRGILVGAIAVSVCIGLLLLWNLDANVYHRLLLSCFNSGKDFEERYSILPKIRSDMSRNREAVKNGVNRFYLISISVLMIAGLVLTILLSPNFQSQKVAYCLLVIACILVVMGIGFMLKAAANVHMTTGNE